MLPGVHEDVRAGRELPGAPGALQGRAAASERRRLRERGHELPRVALQLQQQHLPRSHFFTTVGDFEDV